MDNAVLKLQRQLLREIPALDQWLVAAQEEHQVDPTSEYWLFSYVVRPYLESLYAAKSESELAQAWEVLERIAACGSPSERNELFVTMEELDLWNFFKFMGPALRSHWVEDVTWYPTRRTRTEVMNTHVDQLRFKERWLEEIEKIGGFEKLTSDQQNRISARLLSEFKVEL